MTILKIKNRKEFRKWLTKNYDKETECYVLLKRGKPIDDKTFYYIDAVEEALCFGWIDSTVRKIDGVAYQRFSKRRKKSLWTEQNIARVKRLESIGLMTDAGREVLPNDIDKEFVLDKDVKQELINAKCLNTFLSFPEQYQRIRVYNINFYKKRNPNAYKKALDHLIKETSKGKMYGQWDDYGRLKETMTKCKIKVIQE